MTVNRLMQLMRKPCLIISALLITLSTWSASATETQTKPVEDPRKAMKLNPKLIRAIPALQPAQETKGGTGVYVLDNVDFHPQGGQTIAGLAWNNHVPWGGYYHFEQNSYLIVSGTVHGDGLIKGTGQDGWTFSVQLDDGDILANRPSQCIFARSNNPQTTPAQTGWKYQVMIIFKDTATKPECFNYFKSLADKPIKVRRAKIVGPYWPGNSPFGEPQERLYQSGPMLPLSTDVTAGHNAVLWPNAQP